MVEAGFKECPSCAKMAGQALLCDSCLHNRSLVSLLKIREHELLDALTKTFALASALLDCAREQGSPDAFAIIMERDEILKKAKSLVMAE